MIATIPDRAAKCARKRALVLVLVDGIVYAYDASPGVEPKKVATKRNAPGDWEKWIDEVRHEADGQTHPSERLYDTDQ